MIKKISVSIYSILIISINAFAIDINEEKLLNLKQEFLKEYLSGTFTSHMDSIALLIDKELKGENDPYFLPLSYFIKGYSADKVHLDQALACKSYLNVLNLTKNNLHADVSIQKLHLTTVLKLSEILKDLDKIEQANELINYGIQIAQKLQLKSHSNQLLLSSTHTKFLISKDANDLILKARTALNNAIRINEIELEFIALNRIGLLEIEEKNYNAAQNIFYSILNHESINSFENYKLIALQNLGFIEYLMHNIIISINFYKKSEVILNSNKQNPLSFHNHFKLCEAYLNLDSLDQAIAYGENAISIYDKVDLLPKHYKIFTHLAQAHYRAGNYEKSNYYQNRYFEENMKYMDRVRQLNIDLDEYKIQEQVAGFLSGNMIPDEENGFTLNFFIAWITSVFMALFIGGLIKQRLIKRSLQNSLTEILK